MADDFFRSNLGIQPKQRLISAGSFINPVHKYDANEQMRIVESFRGLSAESDKLIDGFIKKKQDEAQKEYNKNFTEALENPNHPDHKKATDLMEKQKKEVAKFPNLLSTSYWAQQYLFEAQAEQLGQKEKLELQDLADKSVNLSPDEYAQQAGAVRAKFEKELATYPAGVQRAFYRLPREKVLLIMQDRHYEKVAKKNDEMLDVVLANKFRSTIQNAYDGLDTVFQNTTISNDIITLSYGSLTEENKAVLKDTEALYKRVTGRTVGYDIAKGEIVNIEDSDKLYTYAVIAGSNQPDILIAQMVEAANAGRTPAQINTQLTNTIKSLIQEYPDMQEELEALYLITLDKANQSSLLQEKVKSWVVTDDSRVWHDKEIALFDMGQARNEAGEFKTVAVNAARLQQANLLRQEQKNYNNGLKFLWDLRDAGKLDDDYVTSTPVAKIAKDYGISLEEFGEAVADYQKNIIDKMNKPYSQKYADARNYYLEGIRHGRITNKQEITNGYHNGAIHGNDYKELMNEFDAHGANNGAKTRNLIQYGMQYAVEHINGIYGTGSTKANNLIRNLNALMWEAVKRGEIVDELSSMETADKILQRYANITEFKDLFKYTNNPADNLTQPTSDELQTPAQLKEEYRSTVNKGLISAETKEISPVYELSNDASLQAFTKMINDKSNFNFTENEIKEMFANSMQLSKDKRYREREKELTTMLKGGKYNINDFTQAVKERPDLVKEITGGIEFVIENGVAVPKGERERKIYIYNLKNGTSVNDIVKAFRRTKTATDVMSNIIGE